MVDNAVAPALHTQLHPMHVRLAGALDRHQLRQVQWCLILLAVRESALPMQMLCLVWRRHLCWQRRERSG